MTCKMCGSRCHGDRCANCEQAARAEASAGDAGVDRPEPEPTPVECTQCGTQYEHDGQACPECGSRRRRFAGENQDDSADEWDIEQRGLDGSIHTGQATLAGGVAKDGGDQ